MLRNVTYSIADYGKPISPVRSPTGAWAARGPGFRGEGAHNRDRMWTGICGQAGHYIYLVMRALPSFSLWLGFDLGPLITAPHIVACVCAAHRHAAPHIIVVPASHIVVLHIVMCARATHIGADLNCPTCVCSGFRPC